MPDPVIQYFENDSSPLGGGTAINAANPIDFDLATKGRISIPTPSTIHIWNDKGGVVGADAARNVTISLVLPSGVTANPLFAGTALNGYKPMVEARSSGAYGVAADEQNSWTPIGPSNELSIGNIPSNCMRIIEFRVNIPVDAPDMDETEYTVRVNVG